MKNLHEQQDSAFIQLLLKSNVVGFVDSKKLIHIRYFVANSHDFRRQNPKGRILGSRIKLIEMEGNGMSDSWVIDVNTNNFLIIIAIEYLGEISVFTAFNPVVNNSVVDFSLAHSCLCFPFR